MYFLRHCTFPATTSPLFLVFLLSSCASSIVALASLSPSPPRTVLVTGGAGYIGSHTCLELINTPDNRYRVVVLDNLDNSSEESLKRVRELTNCDPDRLYFRQCDLRDKQGVKRGKMRSHTRFLVSLNEESSTHSLWCVYFSTPSVG